MNANIFSSLFSSVLGVGLLVAGVASVSGGLVVAGVGLLLLGAGLWERAGVRA